MPPRDSAPLLAAVRLRRWALAVLAGAGPQAPEWRAPREAPARAWRLFLAAERCALPLLRRLAASGTESLLPPAGAEALRAAAAAEVSSALSARLQLVEFGRVSLERGWPLLVLKGGVAAMHDETAVFLSDVDVLARPEHAPDVAAWLEARGYSGGSDVPVGKPGAWHLAARRTPHAVQVEVHYGVRGLDTAAVRERAVALAGVPGLSRLHPADHLFHMVRHSGVDHPSRRGRIRDLVLVAQAAGECSPAELGAVRALLAALPQRAVLLQALDLAVAVAAGRLERDPFAAAAAANLLSHAEPPSPERSVRVGRAFEMAVYDILAGPGAYLRTLWRQARLPYPAAQAAAERIRRRAPRLARALEGAGRAGLMLACAPAAWRLASDARRLARAAASRT
jgi:hypothetical protein